MEEIILEDIKKIITLSLEKEVDEKKITNLTRDIIKKLSINTLFSLTSFFKCLERFTEIESINYFSDLAFNKFKSCVTLPFVEINYKKIGDTFHYFFSNHKTLLFVLKSSKKINEQNIFVFAGVVNSIINGHEFQAAFQNGLELSQLLKEKVKVSSNH